MRVPTERNIFSQTGPRSNPYRMLLWGGLIFAGISILLGLSRGTIEPLFAPTPTSTRSANSFNLEAKANYLAGDLEAAEESYQNSLRVNPDDAQTLAELARIQTYRSSLLTPENQREKLIQALENIEQAIELDPLNSTVHAIYAFVLDWNADAVAFSEDRNRLLSDAEEAAIRATQLDNNNPLALAYRAEVLSDQQRWIEARDLAERAVQIQPNIMDTHRVLGTVLEATGFYGQAIEEYKKASDIEPNFTYLYIKIGQNYRVLRLYDQALEYFDRAATINELLGIQDPLPYIAIAKTYSRDGEFFIAAINVESALKFDPENPDIYGVLGIIRTRARNFEDAIPVLKCAVVGCSADENDDLEIAINGLPLNDSSLPYYLQLSGLLAAYGIECSLAIALMDDIEEIYFDDSITMSVIQENRNVWAILCSASTDSPPVHEE